MKFLSSSAMAEISRELKKYPPEEKQAGILAALRIAQDERGWICKKTMEFVAELLEIPVIRVCEVATFYSMFELAPIGRHKISVCTNISCMLRGSDEVVDYLTQKLGIKMGETTKDGLVTLREVECLGSCAGAPMLMLDKTYHENLNKNRIDSILARIQ